MPTFAPQQEATIYDIDLDWQTTDSSFASSPTSTTSKYSGDIGNLCLGHSDWVAFEELAKLLFANAPLCSTCALTKGKVTKGRLLILKLPLLVSLLRSIVVEAFDIGMMKITRNL